MLAAVTFAALTCAAVDSAAGNSKEDMQMETGSLGEELLGKSIDEAQQKLGKPINEDQFELGIAVLEFRIELTNFFDEARRTENPPDIREATWSLAPEENLTLWFAQSEAGEDWRAIHFYEWHPDEQF
jgi:hypothetical protein